MFFLWTMILFRSWQGLFYLGTESSSRKNADFGKTFSVDYREIGVFFLSAKYSPV